MGDRLILSPNHSLLYHLCNYLPEGLLLPAYHMILIIPTLRIYNTGPLLYVSKAPTCSSLLKLVR